MLCRETWSFRSLGFKPNSQILSGSTTESMKGALGRVFGRVPRVGEGGRTGLGPCSEGRPLWTAGGRAPLRHFRCTWGLSGELAAVQEPCVSLLLDYETNAGYGASREVTWSSHCT